MFEILNAAFSFPTVLFTALLGCVVLFWLGVILAGLDHDALNFHSGGHADIHLDAHADLGASHGLDAGGEGWADGFLGFLNVGSVPVSIVASAAIFSGWTLSMLAELYAAPLLGAALPGFLVGAGTLALGTCGGLFAAGLATRPMRGVFKVQTQHGGGALLYKIVTITTEKVNASFGQAELRMGGAPLILSVRCLVPNTLSKGKLAVIVGYDAKLDAYEVSEPSQERERVLQKIDRPTEQIDECLSTQPAAERN
ncbi:MAG: hypothetical protein KIS92_19755 [Planctomycetota bacterium]|nr:hypothetical protein [Planctomycetota bacterium]